MRKLLAAMLMTFFLTPLPVISTEKKTYIFKKCCLSIETRCRSINTIL